MPLSSFYHFFSSKELQSAILEEINFTPTMTTIFISASFLFGFCTAVASMVALFQVYFIQAE